MDHEVKFEAAIRWNIRASFDQLGEIKNAAVFSVFEEFRHNLFRVWSFATLLPKMMFLADLYGRAGGRVSLQSSDEERSDSDFTKKNQENISEELTALQSQAERLEKEIMELSGAETGSEIISKTEDYKTKDGNHAGVDSPSS